MQRLGTDEILTLENERQAFENAHGVNLVEAEGLLRQLASGVAIAP